MDEITSASGRWQVREGKADEFIQRWSTWLSDVSQNVPGFHSARLLQAEADPLRFTSVAEFNDQASLKAWKASPGFRQNIESAKELCDDFLGGDYRIAAVFSAPASGRG